MGVIFSQRLKEERTLASMTQEQIAFKLNIPVGTYRSYESISKRRREPDFDMLIKMAVLLNTTTDYLLGKDTV